MALFSSEMCEFMDGEWLVVDNEALELYERYLSDENINFEGINKKYEKHGCGIKRPFYIMNTKDDKVIEVI